MTASNLEVLYLNKRPNQLASFGSAIYCGLALILLVLIVFNEYTFELWDQVIYLRGTDILSLNPLNQPHYLRYLVVYPIFLVSDLFSLDADWLFSILAFFMILMIVSNIVKIVKYTLNIKNSGLITFLKLSSLAIVVLLSSYMNGRILFAMFGFSLIFLSVLKWEIKKISFQEVFLNNILGHLLCSVSTGTFLVSIAFIVSWLLFKVYREKGAFIYCLYSMLMIPLTPIVYLYIEKNVRYYGGGIQGVVKMLSHGTGKVLLDINEVVFFQTSALLVFSFLIGLYLFSKLVKLRLLVLGILCPILGGMFGLSTLAVGAPVFIASAIVLTIMATRVLYIKVVL